MKYYTFFYYFGKYDITSKKVLQMDKINTTIRPIHYTLQDMMFIMDEKNDCTACMSSENFMHAR
jgi:hypothetical protein